jgi:hypothetical protein
VQPDYGLPLLTGDVTMTERHPLAAGLGRLALILPLAIGLAAGLAVGTGGTSTAGT